MPLLLCDRGAIARPRAVAHLRFRRRLRHLPIRSGPSTRWLMPRQNDLRASGLDVTVRQLVGQLAEGTQLLSLEPPRISEQLAQLAKALHEQIRDVEGGLVNDERKADSETRALLDELDKAGAEFYNAITTVRNRLYHGSNGDQAPAQSMTRRESVIRLGESVTC